MIIRDTGCTILILTTINFVWSRLVPFGPVKTKVYQSGTKLPYFLHMSPVWSNLVALWSTMVFYRLYGPLWSRADQSGPECDQSGPKCGPKWTKVDQSE